MPDGYPFPDEFAGLGTGPFYAIRFAPEKQRSDLCLAHAFYRSLRDIPVTCSDPRVASEKLNWWRQEMERSRHSRAQHPIARSMGLLQTRLEIPADHFEPLFQAAEGEIGGSVMRNQPDLDDHCRQTGALFTDLLARIGGSGEKPRRAAHELGSFLRMAEIIRDLGADLRLNRCFIPADLLHRHGLAPLALLTTGDDSTLAALLSPVAAGQRQRYRSILDDLPDPTGLGPVLGLAAMAERTLAAIHEDGFRSLLRQRTSLTPLRKLWICWRCQRRID